MMLVSESPATNPGSPICFGVT